MKAIRLHEHGALDQLRIEEIPLQALKPDEVLVKVKATALNHLDLWVREGIPGVTLPMIMGSDAAGVVERVGAQAAQQYGWREGDEVLHVPIRACGHCEFCLRGEENLCPEFHIPGESVTGVQAEYIAVPASYLMPKPRLLNWAQAAALPLAAMTAYHMLIKKVDLRHNHWVLIYGASSGVGSAAIQIARAVGARVITTVGSEQKADLARALGADYVINYRTESVGKRVKEITHGRGVDVVFEHPGLKTWTDSLRALRKGGKLVTCGATTGPIVKIDLRALFIKHQQLIGSTMGTRQDLLEILQLVERGKIVPRVSKEFPYHQVKEAHAFLARGEQFGKVVLMW